MAAKQSIFDKSTKAAPSKKAAPPSKGAKPRIPVPATAAHSCVSASGSKKAAPKAAPGAKKPPAKQVKVVTAKKLPERKTEIQLIGAEIHIKGNDTKLKAVSTEQQQALGITGWKTVEPEHLVISFTNWQSASKFHAFHMNSEDDKAPGFMLDEGDASFYSGGAADALAEDRARDAAAEGVPPPQGAETAEVEAAASDVTTPPKESVEADEDGR